jgi:endoglucanase
MHKAALTLGLFVIISSAKGSDVVEVRPLTNKIIMIHFDDGEIIYHKSGQKSNNDIVKISELNISAATNTGNYKISSPDDINFRSGLPPAGLGRKSKGTEFSSICEGWGEIPYFDAPGCLNTSPDHVKEHWIFLFLSHPMVEGKIYFVSTGRLAKGNNSFKFIYNTKQLRSDAVHVNQIGYVNNAPQKFGYVYAWIGDKGSLDLSGFNGSNFYLTDSSSNIVYSGKLRFRKNALSQETGQINETPNNNFLGAEVYECDFSSFSKAGSYVLSVEGIGCSFPFSIGADVLRNPFQYVMRGIYQNRSGINLTAPFAQDRPAPHNVKLTPGFAGKLKYTKTTWCEVSESDASSNDKPLWDAGITGDLTETWGWYQDAGDWDGYLTHLKIPTCLMFLYDNFPENFSDGELLIPESGNGHADILDEARWLIRFYKRLRDELTSKGWGTGGVGGARIFGDLWGSDAAPDGSGRGSWQDTTRTWIVSGEDAFTTFWYAGVAAHYAACLKKEGTKDSEGIDWLQEAKSAYTWAMMHAPSNSTCHGFDIRHLRMYAAASLYKMTSDSSYHEQFLADFKSLGISEGDHELTDTKAYGIWQYCMLPEGLLTDKKIYSTAISAIESTATYQLLSPSLEQRACRWGGNFWFPMLVGQATTPMINEGIMGYAFLKNSKPSLAFEYKTVLHNTADYFLGNNPLNMTWITGLGEKYPKGIFHLDSWYSSSGGVRLGIVPYGPWKKDNNGAFGPWRNEWAALTTYPDYNTFPGHERWFDQRTAPLSGEFTIHQTNLSSAFLYGALAGRSFKRK